MAAFWRRFAASGIAFARKYREDLFVQTEVNIIVLQITYAAIILIIAIGSLFILYKSVVSGLVVILTNAHIVSSAKSVSSVIQPFSTARTREAAGLALLIFGATALFGYLVARLALKPARNALASQKQFVGNIAHELRTPLAIVKTNTEIRLMDDDLTPTARRMHEDNLEELDRISNIINNLLSLNALVRPEQMPFDNVDMGKIVQHVVTTLTPLARGKNLHIRVKTAEERFVWGNQAALEQIVSNLLKNALFHTRSGEILISIAPGLQHTIELTVEDTGSGIRKEDLQRIFEPFYRGDQARTRSGGTGSGLGLTIVSELVKLMRGRIRIRSAPGKGTSVSVKFPAARHPGTSPVTGEGLSEVSIDFANTTTQRTR